MHSTLLIILLAGAGLAGARAQDPEAFERYARHQDSLMIQAYEARDTLRYCRYFNDFRTRYFQTDKDSRRNYQSYYFNGWYNLSCTYALVKDKAKAIAAFDSAVQNGFIAYDHVLADKDLDDIRAEPAFRNALARLRSIGDYLYILQTDGSYADNAINSPAGFRYQRSTAPPLEELRKKFNLDSVAGSGNASSRIINLLHWVHNLIPHDGNHNNPPDKNALQLIGVCKKDNRGLNCRGLATVLNECYLASGFYSRMVTCLPKDSMGIDPDCHVIVSVYHEGLKKWLWMDPTNDAYVMDENGYLLSIEEVRRRLITGAPLLLNPDANWNRRASVEKEDYLYRYMAKNLYKLECSISSEYDFETRKPGKKLNYIMLVPGHYQHTKTLAENNGASLITQQITYSPAAFWQSPLNDIP